MSAINKTRIALVLTWLFNAIDTIITLIVTQKGFIELNPVASILLLCPPVFAIVKIALVSFALLYLWKHRTERLSKVASWCAFIIYSIVMLHYLILFFGSILI